MIPPNEIPAAAAAAAATAAAAAAAKSHQSCPTLCDPIDGSTRLHHPWDSPDKNTGVGSDLLVYGIKDKGPANSSWTFHNGHWYSKMKCSEQFTLPGRAVSAGSHQGNSRTKEFPDVSTLRSDKVMEALGTVGIFQGHVTVKFLSRV